MHGNSKLLEEQEQLYLCKVLGFSHVNCPLSKHNCVLLVKNIEPMVMDGYHIVDWLDTKYSQYLSLKKTEALGPN